MAPFHFSFFSFANFVLCCQNVLHHGERERERMAIMLTKQCSIHGQWTCQYISSPVAIGLHFVLVQRARKCIFYRGWNFRCLKSRLKFCHLTLFDLILQLVPILLKIKLFEYQQICNKFPHQKSSTSESIYSSIAATLVNELIQNRVGHAAADYALLISACALYFPNPHKSEYDICGLCWYAHMRLLFPNSNIIIGS